MKKLTFGAALLAAAMVSSCSQNDVNEMLPPSDNVDVISINTAVGVTRATDTSTTSLQSGVKLYYYDSDDSAATAIDFTYNSGGWDASSVLWKNILLPAYFYSVHDGASAQTLSVATGGASADLSTAFNVASAPADQKDLVYYASKLTEMPMGGTINAIHKHALSKLTFFAANGTKDLKIESMKFIKVADEATPTFSTTGVNWGNTTATETFTLISSETTIGAGSSSTDESSITTESMIVIPQEFAYNGASFASVSDSYIEVIYRSEDGSGNNVLGYADVTDYPEYDSATVGGSDYTGALYLKVAFPIATTLVAGTEYAVVLGLGADNTSGGVSLSTDYVNATGDAVTITLKDGSTEDKPLPEPDKPVIPEADDDTYVTINPTSGSWATGANVEL